MAEKGITCPFCGAPYRAVIPADTLQVICSYCGAIILVPPSLGGEVRQCPNHPETLAVGLCNDCGQSYCIRCLYVVDVRGGKMHVCAKCYENRRGMKTFGLIVPLAFSLILFISFIIFIVTPRPQQMQEGRLDY
ncbi:MAG: hypothetical protein QXN87_04245 [Candidatus Bathyarchaeia archaeon]